MPILWIMYILNYVDRTNIVSIFLLNRHSFSFQCR